LIAKEPEAAMLALERKSAQRKSLSVAEASLENCQISEAVDVGFQNPVWDFLKSQFGF